MGAVVSTTVTLRPLQVEEVDQPGQAAPRLEFLGPQLAQLRQGAVLRQRDQLGGDFRRARARGRPRPLRGQAGGQGPRRGHPAERVIWRDSNPYGKCGRTGEEIRFKSLDFRGEAIGLTSHYLSGWHIVYGAGDVVGLLCQIGLRGQVEG